jgi:tetratricopeptide (TPR) repeat protein
MKHLPGKELLQAHSNLCRLAAAGDDVEYELSCIHEYLDEALRQKDPQAEGLARITQLYCYYNYDMTDSISYYQPEALKSMKKNKTWDYYYNAWNILIESYIYRDKIQTALQEAQKMYADARSMKSNYGLGASSYAMGSIYQAMGRFREAEASARRLHRKNRVLYDAFLLHQKAEASMQPGQDAVEELDKEGVLYRQLCELMQKEERLCADAHRHNPVLFF